jgi:hypothetical protein
VPASHTVSQKAAADGEFLPLKPEQNGQLRAPANTEKPR